MITNSDATEYDEVIEFKYKTDGTLKVKKRGVIGNKVTPIGRPSHSIKIGDNALHTTINLPTINNAELFTQTPNTNTAVTPVSEFITPTGIYEGPSDKS